MTSFIIDDIEYKVEINRKRIKNINFRIEDKTIRVSCPFLCTDRYIIDLLKKNEKALIRMSKRSERQESRKEKILYLGNELNFIQFKKIMFDGNTAYGPSVDKVNEYLQMEIDESLERFQKVLPEITYSFVGAALILFTVVILVPLVIVYMGGFIDMP